MEEFTTTEAYSIYPLNLYSKPAKYRVWGNVQGRLIEKTSDKYQEYLKERQQELDFYNQIIANAGQTLSPKQVFRYNQIMAQLENQQERKDFGPNEIDEMNNNAIRIAELEAQLKAQQAQQKELQKRFNEEKAKGNIQGQQEQRAVFMSGIPTTTTSNANASNVVLTPGAPQQSS